MDFKLISLNSQSNLGNQDLSSTYWNDETLEKNKVFNVFDLGFEKIETKKKYIDLLSQLKEISEIAKVDYGQSSVLSVASGTCWLEGQFFKEREFKHMSCIDLSVHRIHKLAPFTLEHYGINPKKVTLIEGSVFDLIEEDRLFDVVILSQAFHHIDEPIRLLRFLRQKLSSNGKILILGEHFYSNFEYHKRSIKHFIKYLINWKSYRWSRNFYPAWQDLFQPDFEKGDIHWSKSEYDFIFKKSGFENYYHSIHKNQKYQAFILEVDNEKH